MKLKSLINEIINEAKKKVTGTEIRDLLVDKGYIAGEPFDYEDAKNLIPSQITYELTEISLKKVKNQLFEMDPEDKIRFDFPPIVHKNPDGYEIIDGKHRLSKLYYHKNQKTAEVYLADIESFFNN